MFNVGWYVYGMPCLNACMHACMYVPFVVCQSTLSGVGMNNHVYTNQCKEKQLQ